MLAAETGCLFAIDTDAHAPGQLDWIGSGCARAEQLGLGPDRIINPRRAGDVTGREAQAGRQAQAGSRRGESAS